MMMDHQHLRRGRRRFRGGRPTIIINLQCPTHAFFHTNFNLLGMLALLLLCCALGCSHHPSLLVAAALPKSQNVGMKLSLISDMVTMDEMRVKRLLASKTFPPPPPPPRRASTRSSPLLFRGTNNYKPGLESWQEEASPRPNGGGSSEKNYIVRGEVIPGSALTGNAGNYFVELEIGTPPKRLVFIIDTGSDLFWARCSFSRAYNSTALTPSQVFYAKNSSTFTPISCRDQECNYIPPPANASCDHTSPSSCTYAYGYSDLSETSGFYGYDTVSLQTARSPPAKKRVMIKHVALGCGTNNTGINIARGGGVLGLGQGPISFSTQVGSLFGGKFSYCFTSFFSRKLRSALVLGEDPRKNLTSRLQFTPFLQNPVLGTLYYIQLEAIKVGIQSLDIDPSIWMIDRNGNGGTIIDSGTTLTMFPAPAFNRIVSTLQELIHYPLAPPTAGLELCYNVSGFRSPYKFPRISMIFKGGATFRPPPRNYFLNPTTEIRCLGMLGSSSRLSVIGNLIQQNYFVQYDRKKNQLGFAKAYCPLAF